jgi:hypothetical protein
LNKLSLLNDRIKVTEKCTISYGWLKNFKDCHGTRKLDVSGEVVCADVEATEQYSELFLKK